MELEGYCFEELEYPLQQLPKGLLELLWFGGWRTAVRIDAGYDDLASALQLVTGLTDFHETAVTGLLWANCLVDWSAVNAGFIQRLRKRTANAGPLEQVTSLIQFRQAHLTKAVVPIKKVSQVLFQVHHWRNRRTRRKAKALDQGGREAVESLEKQRWTDKVVVILRAANVPVCLQAGQAAEPDLALNAVVGRRRSRTLRTRCRMFTRIVVWLQCVHNVYWPSHCGHMLDFLRDAELGPCPKTLPSSISAALSFFEQISGLPESGQIHRTQLWKDNVAELEMRIQGRSGNGIVHKANNLTISMIISLELVVVSCRPAFIRFWAFCILLMVWMSLRFDDLMGLSVSRLILGKRFLKGVLTRTKTTGAGKRIQEVPVYLHIHASFTGHPWIVTGCELLRMPAFAFERDYFVPEPSTDYQGSRQHMLRYSEASGLFRKLLGTLPTIRRDGDGMWEEGGKIMLPMSCPLFWTLHGPRHFVASVAAAEEVPKDVRDMAGRWGIATQQSGEYVLTARTVILNLQSKLLTSISGVAPKYDEDEIMSDYWKWVKERYPDLDQMDLVHLICIDKQDVEVCALHQPWPLIRGFSPEVVEVDVDKDLDSEAMLVPLVEYRTAPRVDEIYWVSVSKKGFRRLHKVGGCHVEKTEDWRFLTSAQAVMFKSDKPCLLCWADLKNDQNSDSGSCDSSSSSSSEGSDIEVQQVVSEPTNPFTDAMTVAEHPIAQDVESSDGFD